MHHIGPSSLNSSNSSMAATWPRSRNGSNVRMPFHSLKQNCVRVIQRQMRHHRHDCRLKTYSARLWPEPNVHHITMAGMTFTQNASTLRSHPKICLSSSI